MVQILIVGPGRVGRALALLHAQRGDAVTLVGHRPGGWQKWAQRANVDVALDPIHPAPGAVLLFCVGDDQLANTCAQWAEFFAEKLPQTSLIAHTSGLHDLHVLHELQRMGATSCIAALHPILAFGDAGQSQNELHDAVVTATWSGPEHHVRGLVEQWQARFRPMPADADRCLYHLSLCLAANHVTALIAQAEQLLRPILGVDALESVLDLAQSALRSTRHSGPAQSLTGPLVRGDLATLQAHVAALADPQAQECYRRSLIPVLELADQSGRLTQRQSKALHDWLESAS